VIQGQEIHGTYADGHRFDTYAPNDPTLLHHHSAAVAGQPPVVRFSARCLAAISLDDSALDLVRSHDQPGAENA
jgi:hypothetical protein